MTSELERLRVENIELRQKLAHRDKQEERALLLELNRILNSIIAHEPYNPHVAFIISRRKVQSLKHRLQWLGIEEDE